jgi:hypothetical protein
MMDADEIRHSINEQIKAWANPTPQSLIPTIIPQRLYDDLIKQYPGYANNPMIQPAKMMPNA